MHGARGRRIPLREDRQMPAMGRMGGFSISAQRSSCRSCPINGNRPPCSRKAAGGPEDTLTDFEGEITCRECCQSAFFGNGCANVGFTQKHFCNIQYLAQMFRKMRNALAQHIIDGHGLTANRLLFEQVAA